MQSLPRYLRPLVSRLSAAALTLGLSGAALAAPDAPTPPPPASQPALPPFKLLPGSKGLADLEYGRANGKPLLLDLYLPARESAGKLPLVVWVHGGGWSAGSRRNPPAGPLLKHGFAVASVEYRFSQEAKFPAQIEDCKAALRWLRANAGTYHIDPDRVGIWGSSAGGHLVAMLGATGGVTELDGANKDNADQSSKVQAVCDWFGPTDFLQMDTQAAGKGQFLHSTPDSPESHLIGGSITDNPAKVAAASPLTYINARAAKGEGKDLPPFLIMHGDKDPLVPHAQSEMLRDALQKAGADVTLQIIPGAGHGFRGTEPADTVVAFFEKHLKAGQ
jgi:acetyl esterase/lipase